MTGLQLALLIGAMLGAGVALALYLLIPARPDPGAVLTRLSPPARTHRFTPDPATASVPGLEERVGIWAQRTLPARLLGVVPATDLAVLRMSPATFYGKKISYALLGLILPPVLITLASTLLGVTLPFVVPAGASLALAGLLFLAPARDIANEAKTARASVARAVGAYVELAALERRGGAGAVVALTNAATVADAWIFRRIAAALARSRYEGTPPWQALTDLGEEIGLPELAELGNIMRMAGDENTAVYDQLRAQATALRSALLSSELEDAGQVEERMRIPGALMGLIFLGLLMTPPLLRILATT